MVTEQNATAIEDERNFRLGLYETLGGKGPHPAGLINQLGIYRPQRGIWVDKLRTQAITGDEVGLCVGVLHTGSSYPDDIDESGVLYHYPDTQAPGRDMAEVQAVKAAGLNSVPVFVISYPNENSKLREVYLGWVEGWEDSSQIFIITFGSEPTDEVITDPDAFQDKTFNLTESSNKSSKQTVKARPNQQKFRFEVMKYYEGKCVFCGLSIGQLIDAAHIRPKSKRGSDDPRNGLLLCSLHHRAFDSGMIAIEPGSLEIHTLKNGPTPEELKLEFQNLNHLPRQPHHDALAWHWSSNNSKFI